MRLKSQSCMFLFDQLKEENDALLLTSGATIARDLPIKNRSLKGIHYAMEFLHSNTKALLDTKLSGGSRLQGREGVSEYAHRKL